MACNLTVPEEPFALLWTVLNITGRIYQWHKSFISRNVFSLMALCWWLISKCLIQQARSYLVKQSLFLLLGEKFWAPVIYLKRTKPKKPTTTTPSDKKKNQTTTNPNKKTSNQPTKPTHQMCEQEELLLLLSPARRPWPQGCWCRTTELAMAKWETLFLAWVQSPIIPPSSTRPRRICRLRASAEIFKVAFNKVAVVLLSGVEK